MRQKISGVAAFIEARSEAASRSAACACACQSAYECLVRFHNLECLLHRSALDLAASFFSLRPN
jgi:hypothetical protein